MRPTTPWRRRLMQFSYDSSSSHAPASAISPPRVDPDGPDRTADCAHPPSRVIIAWKRTRGGVWPQHLIGVPRPASGSEAEFVAFGIEEGREPSPGHFDDGLRDCHTIRREAVASALYVVSDEDDAWLSLIPVFTLHVDLVIRKPYVARQNRRSALNLRAPTAYRT